MRLIDAHDLMERLYDANPKGRVELAELIETEHTVDAEPVVRCKDCKWRGELEHCGNMDSYMWHNKPNDDDFCSWGERREDETD